AHRGAPDPERASTRGELDDDGVGMVALGAVVDGDDLDIQAFAGGELGGESEALVLGQDSQKPRDRGLVGAVALVGARQAPVEAHSRPFQATGKYPAREEGDARDARGMRARWADHDWPQYVEQPYLPVVHVRPMMAHP